MNNCCVEVELTEQVFDIELQGAIISGSVETADTTSNISEFIAGETISALKVIRGSSNGKTYMVNSTDLTDKNTALGVSKTSADINNSFEVVTAGEFTDISWAWNTNLPIFADSTGSLTQTAPTAGYSQVIATAISPTKIKVSIAQAISLV